MSFSAVRTALQKAQTAFGFWLTFPSAAVAKQFLRTSAAHPSGGFSWVLVDAEHGLISDQHYYEICNAIAAEGASPIIRIPWAEEWMIKRALDSGAHGVLTPMCHNADDAKKIVSYSKYPPVGSRGYGPLFAPHSFPGIQPGPAYDDAADKGLMVMVQIESPQGVENVEEITKVEGLDGVLIGPFDLAKSMGVERCGEQHEAAIQRILKAAKDAGKKAAIFCTGGDDAKMRADQGFDMVSVITDGGVMAAGMFKELSTASSSSAARTGGGY
ncbi:Pyruvate/Phosphoenolpyruvate kinase-like domain-containing protein [Microdochium trichocladiopsis]|uniref:Pyruvate/Phosphoenolpyruvate kinase-like domain-containing protein n=1 Tax=Microdochium trichocladiopsis TaxID=1682393 RepID=A0A9P8XY20_9PEZI|nr:Pyruvate/Phosphoenolpyruvate kinase-like domain-containing protein [Microdochium trichocladiopsis]KAH7024918.1 Pyruvate/Phosphoenolpyruvate kinase-like domain-containing protein [Microdochium trichocladiopsis]